MKTKVDYMEQFRMLKSSAEEELKEFLEPCPDKCYSFFDDKEIECIDDIDEIIEKINLSDIPIVRVLSDFDDRVITIYVESVSVNKNGALVVSGFEPPLFTEEIDVRDYSTDDLVDFDLTRILELIDVGK